MIPQLALEAFLALLSVKQKIFMMSVSTVIYFTDQQIQILTSRPGRPGIPAGPLNPGGPAVSFIKKKKHSCKGDGCQNVQVWHWRQNSIQLNIHRLIWFRLCCPVTEICQRLQNKLKPLHSQCSAHFCYIITSNRKWKKYVIVLKCFALILTHYILELHTSCLWKFGDLDKDF